jgi:uncharacterized protein YdaU (DUF1376 family)
VKRDKLLAEWFWTDRWDGSSASLLPMEPRGLYREMLTAAWRRGARLPNDHEAIRRAIGCTVGEWRRCWPKVERFWRVDGEYLVNDTQLEVYAEAVAVRKKAKLKATTASLAASNKRTVKESLKESLTESVKSPPPSPSPVRTTDQAIDHARARPNPLMDGKRTEYEREALALTREIAALTGEDGAEVFARAAHYEGALRQKVNPAAMSDDRLLNTVLDLRATLKDAQAKRGPRAVTA